ncbi:MAG: hypothetical protein O7F69_01945, partial [Alphaproteobacteria bacterium]|nr:hypothetical protein [Alphaproteobacteria bacterium]
QDDFGDEQKAKEESQAAQRLGTCSFEELVIGRVYQPPQRKKERRHDHPGQNWIDAESRIEEEGTKSAGDTKCRMRDVDRVEQPETDRQANGKSGKKAAQQNPGYQRINK